jgi:Zn-dependent protease
MQEIIFVVLVLAFSAILHEVAHGYMANYLGDPTARLAGRLTLNPISHIDPFGSLILPAILAITHSPILIGYAKPVPYNPYNLPGKYDEALVAGAGPATNILIVLIFGLAVRFFGGSFGQLMLEAFIIIAYINMLLALFNLIPIPPLDGSKVLSGILPRGLAEGYDSFRAMFERLGVLQGMLLLLVIFYFLSPYFGVVLQTLLIALTGKAL